MPPAGVDELTGAAAAFAVGFEVNVLVGEGVAVLAVRAAWLGVVGVFSSSFGPHVAVIVGDGSSPEVIWIAAGRVVAGVHDDGAGGDRADEVGVGEAMGLEGGARASPTGVLKAGASVALWGDESLPGPALARGTVWEMEVKKGPPVIGAESGTHGVSMKAGHPRCQGGPARESLAVGGTSRN